MTDTPHQTTSLSAGQRAYEQRRAAKAGMSLERWLGAKDDDAARQARAQEKLKAGPAKAAKKGLFARLLDRAHKPL